MSGVLLLLAGLGTSSQPSRTVWAKKLALVPLNGRITRSLVGFSPGCNVGHAVPALVCSRASLGGAGVDAPIRQIIGCTLTHTLLSIPPQARDGSSLL